MSTTNLNSERNLRQLLFKFDSHSKRFCTFEAETGNHPASSLGSYWFRTQPISPDALVSLGAQLSGVLGSKRVPEVVADADRSGSSPLPGFLSLVLEVIGRLASFQVASLLHSLRHLITLDAKN